MSLTNKRIYHFGEFQLKLGAHVLERQGLRVPLGSKAFALLTYLVTHAGEVVTKDELLKAVWPGSFVEEKNLAQQIACLRKALGDKSDYIATISGRGYQFTKFVQELKSAEPTLLSEDAGEIVQHAMRSRTRVVIEESGLPARNSLGPARVVLYTLGAAGILVLAALAGGRLFRRELPHGEYRQIVLTDFINTTGDISFDRTLKRALEIALEQSPYMDVLSERETVATLQMMGRKSDTAITPDIAKEVCERTNRQVLLMASISNVSDDYLLTLEAVDCNTGKTITAAKAEATSKAKVLGALDSVASHVREGLGESAESVQSYEVPITQATTPSLEALKAYSVGRYLEAQGKDQTETMPLYQRAIELDPQFAMAYGSLATDYYNLSESALAAHYYRKAFELSGRVSEKEKLTIQAHYYDGAVGDLLQANTMYRRWASTYPHDWVPWLDIANNDNELGQYTAAIVAGEQALKLGPERAITYSVLARAYMCAGRFADAKRIGQLAVERSKKSSGLNAWLFNIAFVENDTKGLAEARVWLDQHPDDWFFLDSEAGAMASVGKYKEAIQSFSQAYAITERNNLPETSNGILIDQAQKEVAFGLLTAARSTLAGLRKPASDDPDLMLLRSRMGDVSAASRFVADNKSNTGTKMSFLFLPEARAILQVQQGRPLDAVATLEHAKPYELANYDVPMLRAEAYLQAKQWDMAMAEYRKILANPGIGLTSMSYPLAHLGLARTYVLAGNSSAARTEYENFLTLWKDADSDLPILKSAKAELAKLDR